MSRVDELRQPSSGSLKNECERLGKSCAHASLMILPFIIFVTILLWHLDSVPPVWWDEGWTLSVARNWVELGHYGRLKDGALLPRGLEAGFPVTGSVALSFQIFGVGVYQARLVAVLFALAAFALLYGVALTFYDRPIARATLAVVILLGSTADIQPLLVAQQVLGETAAIAFLLAGYFCFARVEARPVIYLSSAVCLWALTLFTKVQAQPFWLVSLLIPLFVCAFQRKWRETRWIAISLCATAALYGLMVSIFTGQVESTKVHGLTGVIALAFDKHTRLIVLGETLRFGLPTLCGLCWALPRVLERLRRLNSQGQIAHVAFFILAASWFAWYELLSVGWPRYIFPPAFLGSVFVAAMLSEWTARFDVRWTVEKAAGALKTLRVSGEKFAALATVILVFVSLGQTIKILYGGYIVEADDSYKDVLHFLNSDTPSSALIETYESELFFLLQRRYHYPPDQVHVELIRRNSFGERQKINYDPLAANPDYLVVGPQSKFWDFYDPVLQSGAFRLIRVYSRYQIYERVR